MPPPQPAATAIARFLLNPVVVSSSTPRLLTLANYSGGLINHFSYMQSWPDLSKVERKPLPLYDKLGHIAEGNFNFTSTQATKVIDDDPEVERDETVFSFDPNQCEDDLHMYDDPRDAAQSDGPRGATQSDGPKYGTQSDVTRACGHGGSNKKPVKDPKKKKRDDPMVEVHRHQVDCCSAQDGNHLTWRKNRCIQGV
ncbi:hypothetical protein D1007_13968 [Hordeum vulgare]|nr:hypothetical protein D1007_13968 [Hordeum vulgare]